MGSCVSEPEASAGPRRGPIPEEAAGDGPGRGPPQRTPNQPALCPGEARVHGGFCGPPALCPGPPPLPHRLCGGSRVLSRLPNVACWSSSVPRHPSLLGLPAPQIRPLRRCHTPLHAPLTALWLLFLCCLPGPSPCPASPHRGPADCRCHVKTGRGVVSRLVTALSRS